MLYFTDLCIVGISVDQEPFFCEILNYASSTFIDNICRS